MHRNSTPKGSRLHIERLEQRVLLNGNRFSVPTFTSLPLPPDILNGFTGSKTDLNGDGLNDLYVTYDDGASPPAASWLSVLFAHADGSLTESSVATFTGQIEQVFVKDLNGDTRPDFLVHYESVTAGVADHGYVSIFLGQADGSFVQPGISPIEIGLDKDVDVLDMTGDGKLDLFVWDLDETGNVAVYLGNGAGAFGAAVETSLGAGKNVSHHTEDLNNDGALDLVAQTTTFNMGPPPAYTQRLFVHLGSSTGAFDTTASWTSDASAYTVLDHIVDLNKDNYLDLIIHTGNPLVMTPGGDVKVLVNDHSANFTETWSKTISGGIIGAFDVVDLDKDNDLDLVLKSGSYLTAGGTLYVEHNNGSASFTEAQQLTIPDMIAYYAFASMDWDQDGYPDLFVERGTLSGGLSGATFNIYWNDTTGVFGTSPLTITPSKSDAFGVPISHNGDAYLDLMYMDTAQSDDAVTKNNISIFINNHDRTFGPERTTQLGANTQTFLTELDYSGDGVGDLVVFENYLWNSGASRYQADSFRFWQGNADGTFTAEATAVQTVSPIVDDGIPFDLESDGDWDLVLEGVSPIGLHVSINGGGGTPATGPDLTVSALSAPNAEAGALIAVPTTVHNQGNESTGAGFTVSYYLSDDAAFDGSDTLLVAAGNVRPALGAGASDSFTADVTLPEGVTGDKFIIAYVDWNGATGAIAETNESNNTASDALSIGTPPVLLPDLTVENLAVPDAEEGQTLTFSVTIANNGDGDSGADVVVFWYLSSDDVFDEGDEKVSESNIGPLAAHESLSSDFGAVLPQGVLGPMFLIAYVDPENQIQESNEENNTAADGFTIGTPPVLLPNLYVSSLDAPDGEAGSVIAVATQVNNGGDASTGEGFIVSYYLSDDEVLDAGDTLLVATGNDRPALDAGASDEFTADVTLPDGVTGNKFIIAYVDWNGTTGAIAESDETDNKRSDPLTISSPEVLLPNLYVSTVDASDGEAGSVIAVATLVRNNGDASTGEGFIVSYYLSDDQFWDAGDTLLAATGNNRPALDAGASDDFTANVTLPEGVTGDKFIIAYADWNGTTDAIAESDEQDNTAYGGLSIGAAPVLSLTVNEDWNTANDLWQFNGDAARVDSMLRIMPRDNPEYLRGSAFYKTPLPAQNFIVEFDFRMYGGEDVGSNGADGLTFMVQNTPEGAMALGDAGVGLGIGGIVPSLAVEFDTYDNGDIDRDSENHIGVDLDGNPDSVLINTAVPEMEETAGYFHVRITYANSHIKVEMQQPGDTNYVTYIDAAVAGWTATSAYFGFTGATAAEVNNHDIDNVKFWTMAPGPVLQPNLQVTFLNAPDGQTGAAILVDTEVSNTGDASTGAGFIVSYYLSDDNVWDAGDTLLVATGNDRPALAAGASDSFTASVTLPDGVTGDKFIIAYADWNGTTGAIAESNEADNTRGDATTIAAPPVFLPNLYVISLDAPDGVGGSVISVATQVGNNGDASTGEGFIVSYYLSNDSSYDVGDTLLTATGNVRPALAAGASDTFTANVTLPVGFTGDRFIVAYVDWNGTTGAITESDEADNTGSDSLTITAPSGPLPDLVCLIDATTLFDTTVPGDKISYELSVQNIGTAAANGKIGIAFYASTDQTLDASDTVLGTLSNQTINLAVGSTAKKFSGKLTVPANLGPGEYYLLAVVDTTNAIVESNETNNTDATDTSGPVVWQFGTFEDRKNVKLTVEDPLTGKNVTFSVAGSGYGVVAPDFSQVEIFETDAKSSVTIATSKGAETTIGRIAVHGSLKSLSGKTTDLGGDLIADGAIGTLTLDDVADQHAILLGADPAFSAGVTIKFDRVANLSLTSEGPIKSLQVTEWLDTDETPDAIVAPWIATLKTLGDKKAAIAGDFEADVTVNELDAKGYSLRTLTVAGAARDVTLTMEGTSSAITVGAWGGGAIVAPSLGSMTVKSDLSDATIALSRAYDSKQTALSKLSVTGWISNAIIRSTEASIGSITAGGIKEAGIFAALDGNGMALPTGAGDFANLSATLQSVSVKGIKGEATSFRASNIAAPILSKVSLGVVKTDNAGEPFGLAGDQVQSVSYTPQGGTKKSYSKLTDPADSKSDGDFEINVL